MASANYKEGLLYQDSLINANPALNVSELKTRFDLNEEQQENKLLKDNQARQSSIILKQKIINTLITLILIIVIISAWYVLRTSIMRKKIIEQLRKQNELIEKQNLEFASLNIEIQMQKRKLEESIEFKNKLFSIVSHDVRSPLNSLQGLVMLISEGEDIPADMLKTLLQDVAERVQITSAFLDNLLSWAKSQMDGYTPDMQEVPLKKETSAVIDLFDQIAREKNIKIENNIDEKLAAQADQNLLNLVIRNLLSNAIKFTPHAGTIEIGALREDGGLLYYVRDNGIGMSNENIRKVLEGRGYTTLGTFKEKGTGLGLSLCKDFIARMNGKLWVESRIGEGSTFSFSVPIAKRKVMAA
jgi:signal transduction histidine kinase